MKEKRVNSIIVIAIVTIIAAVGVGSYFLLKGEEEGGMGITETPLGENVDIENFFLTHSQTIDGEFYMSLDYMIDVTTPDNVATTYRYRAWPIGTYGEKLRVDYSTEGTDYSCILLFYDEYGGRRGVNGQWMSLSPHDSQELTQICYRNLRIHMYKLYNWTGGDCEWSAEGYTCRIHDIEVNPSFSDSVFQPV